MNSIPLIDATRRLGAAPNWNHETDGICHTLDICDRDGFMISGWMTTDAERKRIADGAPIFLHIQGRVHPVVSLTVGNAADVVPLESVRPASSDR
ncbi:hypothetical protein [Bradyrhizobium retamae]|uniref:Uncharacterized protein n=1 Tax=Bradyrhizobium retamae TaxID=1300035 RepID=A0A0R3N0T2_9BRAD|nr:hypothetical protein [Bradyrhizobium retamae]KRR25944.1 hypothetical protein CQ13_23255 [Bradyrhizobium retamae]